MKRRERKREREIERERPGREGEVEEQEGGKVALKKKDPTNGREKHFLTSGSPPPSSAFPHFPLLHFH